MSILSEKEACGCCCTLPKRVYQLDFVTPGIIPADANSLKDKRDSLNLLRNPRARPVNWQRFRSRIGDESLGILFKATRASALSSSVR
jgi:hypothetical protein